MTYLLIRTNSLGLNLDAQIYFQIVLLIIKNLKSTDRSLFSPDGCTEEIAFIVIGASADSTRKVSLLPA